MNKIVWAVLWILAMSSAYAQVPTISSLTPPANQTYSTGQSVDFTVIYSAAVTVTGTPRLLLNVGGNIRYANYVSGSGSTALVFRYSVVSGFSAPSGTGVASPVDLNGGSIQGAGAVNAALTFTNRLYAGVIISAPNPSIVSIGLPTFPPVYLAGQTVDFTVTFSEPMIASSNASRLKIITGSTAYGAALIAGSGTSTFTYRYTVAIGDYDTDGPTLVSPLELKGSTIKTAHGSAPTLTFSPPSLAGMQVDGRVPTIISNTLPSASGYSTGQQLNFALTYNRNVTVTGNPQVRINVGYPPGEVVRYADYVSGSGTNVLNFSYTVQAADDDLDGVFFNQWLNMNGGTIIDDVGNSAEFAFWGLKMPTAGFSTVTLNSAPPVLASLTPPADGRYVTGQTLSFTANFNRNVTVGGSPRLALTIGGNTRYATYVSGSGSSALLFSYTVASGDADTDGITVASPLQLNGGSINDSFGNNAGLTFTPPSLAGVLVDGIDIAVLAVTPPANGNYRQGQQLDFLVNLTDVAIVTGTPQLQLTVGAATVFASYVSGSGSASLTFRYIVSAGENDSDGIASVGPEILLNGGSIRDAFADDADLNFSAASFPSILVDTTLPTIGIVTGPASGTYYTNQNLDFVVNFSEPMAVSGTPRIALTVGASTRFATYLSGAGTTALTFRYTVAIPDADADGIVVSSPVDLNAGSLLDQTGNAPAALSFTPPVTSGVNVVTATASISSVTPPANARYLTAQALNFTVNFSRPVYVTGSPRIALTVGAATRYATYVSGSGTAALLFTYTVGAGDADTNGITATSPMELNGGTILDSGNASATLTFTPPTMTSVLVDGIALAVVSITPPADATYRSGQQLNFVVNYNYAATVTGTPRIQLTVGASTLYATYVGGTGTTALTFRYTVAVGNLDTDGITTVGPIIQLNGGTIRDAFADNADLNFVATTYPNVKVDAVLPTIGTVTGPSSGTYYTNSSLDFTVNFSEAMTVTGTPRIQLTIGATTRYATYVSGSGSSALLFSYVVVSPDTDTNGIASISPLQLNGGTLLDDGGNAPASLNFTVPNTSAVNVITAVATISSITPPANARYLAGQQLNFVANFSRLVTVTGTPRIQMTVGATTRYADYVSGSGSTALTFSYTVPAGDADTNGIALTSPLQLNGGTIIDSDSNSATLTFTPPGTTGVLVDGIDLAVASVTPPANATYRSGQQLNFVVTYNYAATVTGTPRIQLTVGASTLYATYVSGTGTTTLTFRYTVAAGQLDTDGITTVGPAIQLNGGTIRDAFADNADLNFTAATYPNVKVDAVLPTISSMTVSPNGTYNAGTSIDFTATYSEAVNITGTPRLTLTVGATTVYANYFSGSGTNLIVFRYTVAAGQLDTNGIAMTASVATNGGTIIDTGGNAQTNFNFTAPVLTGVLVDAVAPTIASVTAPANATYVDGSNLNFIVNFSEAVTVTGTPRLTLDIGGITRTAGYVSGSGSTAIVFSYQVVAGDNDSNGIASLSPLDLNGGAIVDNISNPATLTFTGATYAGVRVDTLAPSIASVTPPAKNTYKNGGTRPTLSFTVTFTENVTVTGVPRIHLLIGSTTRYATYASGTGTTNLVFSYAVAATDLDLDGIGVTNSSTIDLNGGTIRDAVALDSSLTMGSLDTSGIYAALASMRSWYDVGDSTKIVLSGANITGLQDKIGTFNLTHSIAGGVPYSATGFNAGVNAYASCSSTGSFNGASTTTPRALVAIFRTPLTAGTQTLFYATSTARPMIQFTSFASGGTVTSGVTGGQFLSGNWGATGATTTNFWAADQVQARGFQWTATQNRAPSVCLMNGELAEMILFSALPTAAQMLEVESYISNRYGLSFP